MNATDGTFSEFLNLLELRGATWCLVEIGPSGGFRLPQSDVMYFYAALDGSIRIAGIAGGTIQLDRGDVAMVLSGEAHAARNRSDARTVTVDYLSEGEHSDAPAYVRIGTPGPVATRLLCGRLKARWPSGLARQALPAVAMLHAGETLVDIASLEQVATGSGSTALLTRAASLMLTLALCRNPQCEPLFLASTANDPIARAVELMDRHFNQHWTVAMLANRVCMGRSNFAARFMSEIGQTPMRRLAERRMRVATELLQSDALKIAEIASRVGYLSEAAFGRCFMQIVGMTPGQMRMRAKAQRRAELRLAGQPAGFSRQH
jgi:AraC-like DNA-binding protein